MLLRLSAELAGCTGPPYWEQVCHGQNLKAAFGGGGGAGPWPARSFLTV